MASNILCIGSKGGQHKEATDIFNKAYKDNSPAARNSLARRLGIEETAKPNKTKGSGSRSTTKFANPRGTTPTGGSGLGGPGSRKLKL